MNRGTFNIDKDGKVTDYNPPKKNITNISFSFTGRIGKERKSKPQRIHLAQVVGHVSFDTEQLDEYKDLAREKIKLEGYKIDGFNCILYLNHGELDGEMVFVQLMPKQSSLFSKGL